MPRVTQLVMGSTARPWVIQDRMRVKPQSDHTESASELAALSVSCPVRQGLTPRNLPIPETCVHPDLHPTGALSTASPPGSYWALCLPELSPRPALG